MMMRTRLTTTVTGGLWFESSGSCGVNAGCWWVLQSRGLDFWFTDEAVVNQNIGRTLEINSLNSKLSKVWSSIKGRAHSSLSLICCLFREVRLVSFSPSSTFRGFNLWLSLSLVARWLFCCRCCLTARRPSFHLPTGLKPHLCGVSILPPLRVFFPCACFDFPSVKTCALS